MLHSLFILSCFPTYICGSPIKFLFIYERGSENLLSEFSDGFLSRSSLHLISLPFSRNESSRTYERLCSVLRNENVRLIIDGVTGGWSVGRQKASGFPYLRLQTSNHPFVSALDSLLSEFGSTDTALILESQSALRQSYYYIVGESLLRVVGASLENLTSFEALVQLRPRLSTIAAMGSSRNLMRIDELLTSKKLNSRDTNVFFVFMDTQYKSFLSLHEPAIFLIMTNETCCILLNAYSSCNCQNMTSPLNLFVKNAGTLLGDALISYTSNSSSQFVTCESNSSYSSLFNHLKSYIFNHSRYSLLNDKYNLPLLTYSLSLNVFHHDFEKDTLLGQWSSQDNFKRNCSICFKKKEKRFFRVGLVLGFPWTYVLRDDGIKTLELKDMNSSKFNFGLDGYSIHLLVSLAKKMNFDYEIILSKNNEYGEKLENNSWTGLIGDLISGEIDLSLSPTIMTTSREEVIDFVTPYLDQSGISIIIRTKESTQSIFKFMTVLKKEVWGGILAAVSIVTILIWALDRFSPYSYRNNRIAYPDGGRDFTLMESLCFSLTSLTPQGGGEVPKALSGRILVGAYWLFIVLMLATFTANLAAFLTVERMQTTVQSLDELSQQSKITYTAVSGSRYYRHFEYMANAEEELYHKWKELTLNSSRDQSKYRIWDYPIREKYSHILKVMREEERILSSEEGFARVNERTKGDFAFFHDSAEVRYQYYNNCNFTLVGEPFAEQPLAIAVQQGAKLQKEISKTILELQKERYFERLSNKIWDVENRNNCPVIDDSRGITLRSLGGIFLAALCGLLLSMITLAIEVWSQKKNEKKLDKTKKTVQIGGKIIRIQPYPSSSKISPISLIY